MAKQRIGGKVMYVSNYQTVQERFDYTELDPDDIEPLNDITDEDKYNRLIKAFTERGFNGYPILAYDAGEGVYYGLTGSHRVLAAREAGIEIPAVIFGDYEVYMEIMDGTDDDSRQAIAEELYKEKRISKEIITILRKEDR